MKPNYQQSLYRKLGLPMAFGPILLTITIGLALSPYLAGADFGLIKIPQVSSELSALLKWVGPILVILAIVLFIPYRHKQLTSDPSQSTTSATGPNNVDSADTAFTQGEQDGPQRPSSYLYTGDPDIKIDWLLALSECAGDKAREMLEGDWHAKDGRAGIVSDADFAVEELLIAKIKESFPACQIISEESKPELRFGGLVFFVDPIDGTVNYIHGLQYCSVSIAACYAGKIVAGVVHNIPDSLGYAATFDSTSMGIVQNGDDARFLSRNLEGVSTTDHLGDSLLITGYSADEYGERKHSLNYLHKILGMSQGVRRFGSAALDLAAVANGRVDGYWETAVAGLWDVLAGAFLVRAAGGRADVYYDSNTGRAGAIATNGRIHNQLTEATEKQFSNYDIFGGSK